MSTIRLLIIKGNTLYSQECPWRIAIKFLNNKEQTQNRFLRLIRNKHYLDAGYILVDYDQQLFISNQSAFAIHHLNKTTRNEIIKNWRITENI